MRERVLLLQKLGTTLESTRASGMACPARILMRASLPLALPSHPSFPTRLLPLVSYTPLHATCPSRLLHAWRPSFVHVLERDPVVSPPLDALLAELAEDGVAALVAVDVETTEGSEDLGDGGSQAREHRA